MAEITANGLWIPDETDHKNVTALIKEAMNSVETGLGMGAWVDITLTATGAVQGSPAPRVRKAGKHVKVNGLFKPASGSFSTTANHVGTIPDGYRPPSNQYFIGRTNSVTIFATIEIKSDGTIWIFTSSTASWVSVMNCDYWLD